MGHTGKPNRPIHAVMELVLDVDFRLAVDAILMGVGWR
jgi:hypothetical protein